MVVGWFEHMVYNFARGLQCSWLEVLFILCTSFHIQETPEGINLSCLRRGEAVVCPVVQGLRQTYKI